MEILEILHFRGVAKSLQSFSADWSWFEVLGMEIEDHSGKLEGGYKRNDLLEKRALYVTQRSSLLRFVCSSFLRESTTTPFHIFFLRSNDTQS